MGSSPDDGLHPSAQSLFLSRSVTRYTTHKETLSFEVINIEGPYHAILERPCYAKFMAIPSYAYFKLKIPGPRGVITVASSFQDHYECERLAVE
jgi:hypothetical protein